MFTGSEGVMQVSGDSVVLTRLARRPAPDYDISSFAAATQEQFLADFRKKHPVEHPSGAPSAEQERYVAPIGYNDVFDHFANFFAAECERGGRSVKIRSSDTERQAQPALLANVSYEGGKIVRGTRRR